MQQSASGTHVNGSDQGKLRAHISAAAPNGLRAVDDVSSGAGWGRAGGGSRDYHSGQDGARGHGGWPEPPAVVYSCHMNESSDGTCRADIDHALTRTLHRRAVGQGSITLPAVPAMLEDYVTLCLSTFAALSVDFDDEQRRQLRDTLRDQLDQAFAGSPRSSIVITYDTPVGTLVNYHVRPEWTSIASTYDAWVATRQPPYFGSEPDARVWALAGEYPDPKACPVLDIGAGTGRNSLALARRGHPVDALELSGSFADVLREQARAESLGIRVIQRDLFTAHDYLPGDYGLVVVSEVVTDFRSPEDLRRLFELAVSCLFVGGHLVVNMFVARASFEPGDAARQMGQQTFSSMFTQDEVDAASDGLPLELVDVTGVYDYEHAHLPPESWPPTGWYEGWVLGQDVFALGRAEQPIEMRWLVYRRASDDEIR